MTVWLKRRVFRRFGLVLIVVLSFAFSSLESTSVNDQPLIILSGADGVATVSPTYDVTVTLRSVIDANNIFSDVVRLYGATGYESVVGIADLTINAVEIKEFRVFVTYLGNPILLLHFQNGLVLTNSTFLLHAETEAIMGMSIITEVIRAGPLNPITFRIAVSYERAFIDVYTQKAGAGAHAVGDAFAPGELVTLTAHMTYGGQNLSGLVVTFQVNYPDGGVFLTQSDITDEAGLASVSFRLSMTPVFGVYNAYVSASYLGYQATDVVPFMVGWIVRISSVTPIDALGNPRTSFARGSTAYFKIVVDNIALSSKEALITVNPFDKLSQPLGVAAVKGWIASGSSEYIISMPIPMWALLGAAIVRANSFTEWPSLGGVAYGPENSALFDIASG